MAFSCKSGTFVQATGTGNQAVTGVGFQPKAIIFFTSGVAAEGFNTTANETFGMAVSSSSRACISANSRQSQTTMDTRRGHHNTACIAFANNTADTFLDVADLVSFDSDGFTINWSVNAALNRIINYVALGGTDLTNVAIKEFTSKATTGSQAYTGVGFQPDCIIFMSMGSATAPNIVQANNVFSVGWATSSSAQSSIVVSSTDNVPDCVSNKSQRTDRCIMVGNNDSLNHESSLTSMDSDGFTLNVDTESGAGGRYMWALCLKGGRYKVGSDTQKTSGGTKATTGVGFTPVGLFLQSFGATATTSLLAGLSYSLGSVSSTTSRSNLWSGDLDAAATSDTDRYQDDASCLTVGDNTGAIVVQADISSLDSDGFTLNWGTADATAREFVFLAFGNGGTAHTASSVIYGQLDTNQSIKSLIKSNILIQAHSELQSSQRLTIRDSCIFLGQNELEVSPKLTIKPSIILENESSILSSLKLTMRPSSEIWGQSEILVTSSSAAIRLIAAEIFGQVELTTLAKLNITNSILLDNELSTNFSARLNILGNSIFDGSVEIFPSMSLIVRPFSTIQSELQLALATNRSYLISSILLGNSELFSGGVLSQRNSSIIQASNIIIPTNRLTIGGSANISSELDLMSRLKIAQKANSSIQLYLDLIANLTEEEVDINIIREFILYITKTVEKDLYITRQQNFDLRI